MYRLLFSAFLSKLDPEDAHQIALRALQWAPLPAARPDDSRLRVRAFGLDFPNPVGLAAGFDKNAEVPDALLKLGFGFVETGGVTPRPQAGNPRPRLFRLDADGAVINRLGLNSDGAAAVRGRLAARAHHRGIVGINIGPNRDSQDRTADYVQLVETFAPVVSYITINVSSPNTPGLRNLQQAKSLDDLMARALQANHDVRIAVARIDQARAILDDIRLDRFPTVTAGASVDRRSEVIPGFSDEPRTITQYRIGFDAFWELDVFGRIRNQVRSAEAATESFQALADDVRVSIADGRRTVRSPARVGDARRSTQRVSRELAREVVELALRAPPVQPALVDRADARRIIAAIFQPLEPVEQPFSDAGLPNDPDDSAHVTRPLSWSSVRGNAWPIRRCPFARSARRRGCRVRHSR